MLVSIFRNTAFAKCVGGTVAIAFLFTIVGYKNFMRFVVPGIFLLVLFLSVRRWLVRRKMRLTQVEEDYLKKRFYKH